MEISLVKSAFYKCMARAVAPGASPIMSNVLHFGAIFLHSFFTPFPTYPFPPLPFLLFFVPSHLPCPPLFFHSRARRFRLMFLAEYRQKVLVLTDPSYGGHSSC